MKRYFNYLPVHVQQALQNPYFGFIQGHSHLTHEEIHKIKLLVGKQAYDIVADFETQFAKLIGEGEAVSYASGRMGFYHLMQTLKIGQDDEVVLLGATCAVMVNAVLKTGAKPVFSDIDIDTFGSEVKSIEKCITQSTKMIVAQHSFGIPCAIEPIFELALSKDIFLVEDCALSLGSRINDITIGNFGHAALFSTDHSKPLNTLIGGVIYTSNNDLARRLRKSQESCLDLSLSKQQALYRQLLLERRFCVPQRYGLMGLINLFARVKKKIFHTQGPFLSDDFGANHESSYPYPAKLPAFLAAVGLIEVKRWPKVAFERKALLKNLFGMMNRNWEKIHLPEAYTDERLDIIPLRFAWFQEDGANVRDSLKDVIHVSWTWFMRPIVATNEPLERLGYKSGDSPVSENIGPNMINLPCNISPENHKIFLTCLDEVLK